MRGDYMAIHKPIYIADRYRLKKKNIGGGNMSSIFLCEDIEAQNEEDTSVIVKMFNKPSIGDLIYLMILLHD